MSVLRKKYVAPRSTNPAWNVIYRVRKIGKVSNVPELQSKPRLASFYFMDYLHPKNVDKKIVIKSTVANTRRRSKRAVDYSIEPGRTIKPVESPNRQSRPKSTNVQETPNRLLSILQNLKFAPNLAMFYRHPELSVEEQHQQLNKNSREPPKSRAAREENRLARLKASRTRYRPVFKECNDTTAASEVEDLNIPPPRPKYLKPRQPYIPDIDLPAKDHYDQSSRRLVDPQIYDGKFVTPKIDALPKQIKRPKSSEIHSGSPKSVTPKNVTYVNLRDHQEEAKKVSGQVGGRIKVTPTSSSSGVRSYPKDAQSYNPDNIPYVEVPDYSDQREESLDEDDRRVAKERYRNANDGGEDEEEHGAPLSLGSDDVVDPDAPEAIQAHPDPAKNTPRTSPTVTRSKSTGQSESVREHHDDVDMEKTPESGDHLLHPDVSGRQEYTSETGRDRSSETVQGGTPEKPVVSGLPADAVQVGRNTDDDRSFEDKSQDGNDDDSQGIVDFRPVHFDIKEYIKPFDYGKLFASEKKKSDDESSDYSADDSREGAGSENSNSKTSTFSDRFSSRYGRPSENKTFFRFDSDREDSDEDPKEFPIIKPDEFSFGNKDFFRPISDEERLKSDRFISTSDFLSRFFSDDDDKSDRSDASDDDAKSDHSEARDDHAKSDHREARDDHDKRDHSEAANDHDKTESEKPRDTEDGVKEEEAYKTLSTSLEQKDHVPKSEDNRRADVKKDGAAGPREYNNFWTLEYTFPPEKINHELRKESRDEDNTKNIKYSS